MKRAALTRKTPLRRKARLRARSKTNSYRRRERNFDYMRLVRKLPCIVRQWGELTPGQRLDELIEVNGDGGMASIAVVDATACRGHIQTDHVGPRPLSHKCPDDETAPLCKHHHEQRTDVRGMFRNWTAPMMRAWCDWAIKVTRDEVAGIAPMSGL